jgi:hypothetical protein
LLPSLDNHIGRVTAKWKEQGVFIAVTNFAALFEYGLVEAIFTRAFAEAKKHTGTTEEIRTGEIELRADDHPVSNIGTAAAAANSAITVSCISSYLLCPQACFAKTRRQERSSSRTCFFDVSSKAFNCSPSNELC